MGWEREQGKAGTLLCLCHSSNVKSLCESPPGSTVCGILLPLSPPSQARDEVGSVLGPAHLEDGLFRG